MPLELVQNHDPFLQGFIFVLNLLIGLILKAKLSWIPYQQIDEKLLMILLSSLTSTALLYFHFAHCMVQPLMSL